MTVTLKDLAVKYGVDLVRHGNLSLYEGFLSNLREEMKRVLLVGKGHGASIRMWLEYFPKAEVYGVGLDKGYNQDLVGFSGRYHPYSFEGLDVCQMMQWFLGEVRGRFGFIIDEGLFSSQDQKMMLEHLLVRLDLRGYYVLEEGAPPDLLGQLKQLVCSLTIDPPSKEGDPLLGIFYSRLLSIQFLQGVVVLRSGIKQFVFDELYYLESNPDVARAVKAGNSFRSGLQHYLSHGFRESRKWRVVGPKCEIVGIK